MKEAVFLAEPNGDPKQIRKMLRREHGRFWPIRYDASFSQKYYTFYLRNNFRNMMRHQQNPEPGFRKLAHRIAKLQLRRDVQRVARLVEKQRLWLMHQRSRN